MNESRDEEITKIKNAMNEINKKNETMKRELDELKEKVARTNNTPPKSAFAMLEP